MYRILFAADAMSVIESNPIISCEVDIKIGASTYTLCVDPDEFFDMLQELPEATVHHYTDGIPYLQLRTVS